MRCNANQLTQRSLNKQWSQRLAAAESTRRDQIKSTHDALDEVYIRTQRAVRTHSSLPAGMIFDLHI
jgi:hypothetical protein